MNTETQQNKLFRIIVLHGAPKDSHKSTETYLVAKDDEEVLNFINEAYCFGEWFGGEDCCDNKDYYDDEKEEDITFKEYILRNRGDLSDENGWDNAYYGVTKWGWEEIKATKEEMNVLIKLGIAVRNE